MRGEKKNTMILSITHIKPIHFLKALFQRSGFLCLGRFAVQGKANPHTEGRGKPSSLRIRKALSCFLIPVLCSLHCSAIAQEITPTESVPDPRTSPMYGHSMLGSAFDDVPRQRAYLMRGMPKIVFPITTTSSEAQRYFEQGIGQLHGYWYLEAQRSFRKVAALDPQCAMAYWGIAMTRFDKDSLAKESLAPALRLLKSNPISEREKLWIQALNMYYAADAKMKDRDKVRQANYLRDLKSLAAKYPADLEAKAFLAHTMMDWRYDDPKPKLEDIDALLRQILAKNPMHPVHHYRIHLWDGSMEEKKKAVDSAGQCGASASGIAHMWHMQGHIFSGLHRYNEAVFAQEAAVRVDNRYLMADRLMPDQIHNYAHNSQWLVENLGYVGRVRDAIDLAKNMLELPRHPSYNSPEASKGSAYHGRLRLMETLLNHELWREAIDLNRQGYLEEGNTANKRSERLELLAIASLNTGDVTAGKRYLSELEALRDSERPKLKKDEKPDKSVYDEEGIKESVAEVRGYLALLAGEKAEALKQFALAKSMPKSRLARVRFALGQTVEAEKLAREAVDKDENQVEQLATLTAILSQTGKQEEAKFRFRKLREVGSRADLDAPLLAKLAPLAKEFGYPADWRIVAENEAEQRREMARLGQFRWEPYPAPNLMLQDMSRHKINLSDYRKQGRPVVVLFYLGYGCEHCMTQLNAFAPLASEFEKAGISLVAVSADNLEGLQKTFTKSEPKKPFPFPLLSDSGKRAFRAFRAYDDFERSPLHGLFLIDGTGQVRWQEIRFEPFQDVKFLLSEAKRLLNQKRPADTLAQEQKPSSPKAE